MEALVSTGLAFRQSNGRPPRRDPIVVLVDELTPGDLEAMDSEGPHHSAAPVSELKPSHHAVARYFAVGLLAADVSRVTGYSQVTLSLLMKSPAFQELLHFYREEANQAAYDIGEKINLMTTDTLAELHKRVLESPDELSSDFLRKLSTDLMDRHPEGHSPVHRSVTKSVHVGLTLEDIREIKSEIADGNGSTNAIPPYVDVSPDPAPPNSPGRQLEECAAGGERPVGASSEAEEGRDS
jgi:hypothetical protein